MIEFMTESHGNLLGIEASGTLTDVDYKDILIPRLDTLFHEHDKLKILFYMKPGFAGWDLAAAWDDAALAFSHRAAFEKIAIVGGPGWVGTCIKLFGFLVKGEIETFEEDQVANAWTWLST